MTIVINQCYGGFSLPQEFCDAYNYKPYDNIDRTDSRLVQFVRDNADKAHGWAFDLAIVEIPDEATDWELNEYDGYESITYVMDGKLFHA